MSKTEITLRPGDSLTLKLQLGGTALRLDLSLTHDGVAVSRPSSSDSTDGLAYDSDAEFPATAQAIAAANAAADQLEAAMSDTGRETVQESEGDLDISMADLDGQPLAPEFSAHAHTMIPPTRRAMPQPIEIADEEFTPSVSDLAPPELGDKPKFAPNPDDTLPVWDGRAREYRDPNLEQKRASDPPSDFPDADLLDLAPADNPVVTQYSPPPPKPPTQPVRPPTQPVRPATGPGAQAVSSAGDFTVFLTPPKSDKLKNAAAAIIAQIQGLNQNDALALAGKMIVPIVKGVAEQEAHRVRDLLKGAGLSCRITQKR